MIKGLKSALTASISEVLETMFYMPLELDENALTNRDVFLDAPDLRMCRLAFSGKLNGYFLMAIRESLLIIMAKDFMGEEKDTITRHHTNGIIKEALNMVAGRMFANMDEETEYNLNIPELLENKDAHVVFRTCSSDYLVWAESIEGVVACLICLE